MARLTGAPNITEANGSPFRPSACESLLKNVLISSVAKANIALSEDLTSPDQAIGGDGL